MVGQEPIRRLCFELEEHHHLGMLNVLQLTWKSNGREFLVKEKADSLSRLVYGKEIFPE